MNNKITKNKVEKYKDLTKKALKIAEKSVFKGKEKYGREIIKMVLNYLSDSEYFEKKGDLINAFAALNYAHGWIDAGVRLDIFNVKDNKLFTIK